MKIRRVLILPVIASMLLGAVMIGPVSAQMATIGVEPDSIIDLGLGPGSWFTVEIWIRDIVDLYGIEYKLGYDTTVLTATSIEYGGIFGPSYILYRDDIYDADGYLYHGLMQFPEDDPFSGDGLVATINFTVDSLGQSALDLYDTQLGKKALPYPLPIPHLALDGYFRNAPISVTLSNRKAWPEHHNFEVWWDEDNSNDLFATVKNDGDVGTYFKVVFTVTFGGMPVGDLETPTIALAAGELYGKVKPYSLKTAFVPPMLGKYEVSARCWADTDGDTVPDTAMGSVKTFAFRVVTELLN